MATGSPHLQARWSAGGSRSARGRAMAIGMKLFAGARQTQDGSVISERSSRDGQAKKTGPRAPPF